MAITLTILAILMAMPYIALSWLWGKKSPASGARKEPAEGILRKKNR